MSAEYNPNKLGWGAAAITCIVTAGLALSAYTIHKNTYRHPRDPMATQVYQQRDMEAATAEHGGAAAMPAAEHADVEPPKSEANAKH